jgi:AcrR family transcriptional regulator
VTLVASSCNLDPAVDPVKLSTPAGPPGRQRARATRLRITKAAAELFRHRGYTRTTMADIAAAAGVAVQTVYFVFHTKTEVLDSAYSLAVMGEDDPAVPQDQAWYRQAVAEPDVTIAVRLVVEGVSEILRRVAPLDYAVRTAAAADPEAAAFLARNEGMRMDGYREMVEFLVRKCPLPEDLPEERGRAARWSSNYSNREGGHPADSRLPAGRGELPGADPTSFEQGPRSESA